MDVAVAAWEWGAYLGEEGLRKGIRAKISSWRRIGSSTIPATAKAGGQYLNSILAKIESHKAGYQEAILLNEAGYVADGSGENLFLVRDGALDHAAGPRLDPRGHHARQHHRPGRGRGHPGGRSARSPAASSTPPTRSSSPARPPRCARSTRSTTTTLGPPGPITRRLQQRFFAATEGRDPRSVEWLDYVETPEASLSP